MLNKYFLFILICSVSVLWGQEVTFEAKASKTEVSINERFSVQFVVSINKTTFQVDQPLKLPEFNGLHQLAASQQSNTQIINGEITNYSGIEVILIAEKEGEFTIGSATITIDGKRYKTEPIKISVKKGLKPKVSPNQRLSNTFIKAEISNETPFVNQQAIVAVKIYTKDLAILNRLRKFNEPDFSDLIVRFVSEKSDDFRRQEFINGETYISQELARYIVFPQKSGEIELDPFSVDVLISGYYGAEIIQISSQPIVINVKELPKDKPRNFSGAVGDFKINTFISKQQVKANQAVNLELEIVGSGNLNILKTPNLELPEHIETYPPKKRDAFEARPNGIVGKVSVNHVLVPQYGGTYPIGPIQFSYFDPEKNEYITLSTDPITLQVKGPNPPKEEDPKTDNVNDSLFLDREKLDSSEVNQIINLPENITNVKNKVVSSVSKDNTWLWLLLCLLLVPIFVYRKKIKRVFSESKASSANVEKELKSTIKAKLEELNEAVQSGDAYLFYQIQDDILTSLGIHYTQTKLADFTEESVAQKIEAQFNSQLAQRWKSLLVESKQAQYANIYSSDNLSVNQQQIETIVRDFFSHK